MSLQVEEVAGPHLDIKSCQISWKKASGSIGSKMRVRDLELATDIVNSAHFIEYKFDEIERDREKCLIRIMGFRWITLAGCITVDLILVHPFDMEILTKLLRHEDIRDILHEHLLNYLKLCYRIVL